MTRAGAGFLLRPLLVDFVAFRLALAIFDTVFLSLRATSSARSPAIWSAALASLASLRSVLNRALALPDSCLPPPASLTASLSCRLAVAASCFAAFKAASSLCGFILMRFAVLHTTRQGSEVKSRPRNHSTIRIGRRQARPDGFRATCHATW